MLRSADSQSAQYPLVKGSTKKNTRTHDMICAAFHNLKRIGLPVFLLLEPDQASRSLASRCCKYETCSLLRSNVLNLCKGLSCPIACQCLKFRGGVLLSLSPKPETVENLANPYFNPKWRWQCIAAQTIQAQCGRVPDCCNSEHGTWPKERGNLCRDPHIVMNFGKPSRELI